MPRQATRKKGAYTRAEIQRRYRQRLKRKNPSAKAVVKQQRRAGGAPIGRLDPRRHGRREMLGSKAHPDEPAHHRREEA